MTQETVTMRKTAPDPIDVHVGSRVRLRRMLLGVSQEKLGDGVDLTFQQIQKYEKGTNRIGASRLAQFAAILKVEPAYFFEGAPKPVIAGDVEAQAPAAEAKAALIVGSLDSAEGLALNRDFASIRDPKVRRRPGGGARRIGGSARGGAATGEGRMKHLRNFILPRLIEFDALATVQCADCAGTGSAETSRGSGRFDTCQPCGGSGEVVVFDNETMEVGHA